MRNFIASFVEPSTRLTSLLTVLGVVALLVIFEPPKVAEEHLGASGAARSNGSSVVAKARTDSISGIRRELFSAQGVVDLFSSTSWLPPAPIIATPKLVAPTFPYHYVGRIVDDRGQMQIYLAEYGSGVIATPKRGDTLAGGFHVNVVSTDHITVTYLPLNEKLTILYSILIPEPGLRQTAFPAAYSNAAAVAVADTYRGTGAIGVADVGGSVLPSIAGLASIVTPVQIATSAAVNSGSVIGVSSAASSSTNSGASSPAAPGAAPTGAILGAAPVAGDAIGIAPAAFGSIGTAPTNTDTSALNGAKPTSGGPAIK